MYIIIFISSHKRNRYLLNRIRTFQSTSSQILNTVRHSHHSHICQPAVRKCIIPNTGNYCIESNRPQFRTIECIRTHFIQLLRHSEPCNTCIFKGMIRHPFKSAVFTQLDRIHCRTATKRVIPDLLYPVRYQQGFQFLIFIKSAFINTTQLAAGTDVDFLKVITVSKGIVVNT